MLEAHDVASRLEAAFSRIHAERMDGVPILNPRLAVEAVGTRLWNDHWLAVLITPWFINLMLLPQTGEQQAALQTLAPGSSVAHAFPAGRFDFLVGEEEAIGRYQMCSLFSPVLEFEDQAAARIAAEAALDAVFDAGLQEPPAPEKREENATAPTVSTDSPVTPAGDVSRRGLLTGLAAPERGRMP